MTLLRTQFSEGKAQVVGNKISFVVENGGKKKIVALNRGSTGSVDAFKRALEAKCISPQDVDFILAEVGDDPKEFFDAWASTPKEEKKARKRTRRNSGVTTSASV